jgi:DNA-binding GntR family transcriptional regulator
MKFRDFASLPVRRDTNREGLHLQKHATESTTSKLPKRNANAPRLSSPDRVVEAITDGIRAGRFVPGQRLIEADLTHNLRVSRGPVREALTRLSAEGIVTLTLHRGAYIRALQREEAKKILLVLEVLTGLAANLAASEIDNNRNKQRMREAYEHLKQIHESGGVVSYLDERRHFYDTVIEIGGNEQIAKILPTMQIHLLRMQFRSYWTPQENESRFNDYSLITSAILEGDPKKAERQMRAHIHKVRVGVDQLPDNAFPVPAA